jgi:hypothetical protein
MSIPSCITLRTVKGSVLSWAELDNNFVCLNNLINSKSGTGGNQFHIPSGDTVTVFTDYQYFFYGDIFIEGTLELMAGSQLVVLNGDIITGGTGTITGTGDIYNIDLPEFDTKVTGMTYSGNVITVYQNDGSTYSSVITTTDIRVSGLTYSGNVLTLSQTDGSEFNVTIPQFTGNTSGDCITDIYVSNVNSCSPLHIQPNSNGNVLIGENGGVNVGIGTTSPTAKLHVIGQGSGNTTNSLLAQNSVGSTNLLLKDDGYFSIGRYSDPNFSNFYVSRTGNKTTIGGDHPASILSLGVYGNDAIVMNGPSIGWPGDVSITQYTTIGGSSRGLVGYTARVGISGDGSFAARQLGFQFNANNGLTLFAIGNENDTSFNSTIKLYHNPGQFGIDGVTGSTSEQNNSFRIGIGTASQNNYRLTVSDGVKIIQTPYSTEAGLFVSGKTKTTNLQMTSGATSGYILISSDSDGNGKWSPVSGITGIGNVTKYTTNLTFTDSETKTITHNLNTKFVHCSVWDTSTNELITPQVVRVTGSETTSLYITISTGGNYDILITG